MMTQDESPIIETERMRLYPISNDEMRNLIEKEPDPEMKQAYTEMLEGCLKHPTTRIWNAVWLMELKDDHGTIAGDLSFKGLGADGMVEIGYGLKEAWRHHGLMSEAVTAVTAWAMQQPGVERVEAETEPDNVASQRVLVRSGYIPTGIMGKEGPRFVYVNQKKL